MAAASFCAIFSFKKFRNRDDVKSDATTSSDTTTASSMTTASKQCKGKSFRDELTKSRKVNATFMRNYTLLENIPLVQISQQIMYCPSKPDFPIRQYAVHSHRGLSLSNPKKKNQDSISILQDQRTQSLCVACLDGHGQFGEIVSQYVAKGLEESLCSHAAFADDLHTAISDTISSIETRMFEDKTIDSSISGTTLTIAVVRGTHLTVANVGDSRVVVITKRTTESGKDTFHIVPLSIDHTPDLEAEKARILAAGGRVFGVKYPDGSTGPDRVWLGKVDAPGLAMSRSVGDKLVHGVGVISTPEYLERDILEEDVALLVASDGLWNVLSDEEVVKHVMSSRDASGAVGLLLREARIRWLTSGSCDTVDDTTIMLAYFHGR